MSNPPEDGALKDLTSRRWTKMNLGGEALTSGMMRGSCAIVPWDEKRAIVTGGRDENFQATDSVFVYNKETMEISTLPSMLEKRQRHSAVIVGGNLFVIGGWGPNFYDTSLNSIEVLDLHDPVEWKQYPVSLEIARFACSAVAVNDEIYIIGGYSLGQLNSVEILNTLTKTISQGPPMLERRQEFAAALIGDAIVVVGGYSGQDYKNTCEQLSIPASSDEEARRWQPLHSMNIERTDHYGLTFGDCMVVVGGVNRTALELTTTEVWNSATGAWTQLPAELPDRGFVKGFVKLGNDLVCFLEGRNPKVCCLFSAQGLLEQQRRQIRFNELIADERTEVVIPLLLEGLGQRGWTSLFYDCIRETNGRLIHRRNRSALGKRSYSGQMKRLYDASNPTHS